MSSCCQLHFFSGPRINPGVHYLSRMEDAFGKIDAEPIQVRGAIRFEDTGVGTITPRSCSIQRCSVSAGERPDKS